MNKIKLYRQGNITCMPLRLVKNDIEKFNSYDIYSLLGATWITNILLSSFRNYQTTIQSSYDNTTYKTDGAVKTTCQVQVLSFNAIFLWNVYYKNHIQPYLVDFINLLQQETYTQL